MRKRMETRRERINRLNRMQEVALINIKITGDELSKTRDYIVKKQEQLLKRELTPEELETEIKRLNKRIDKSKKNYEEIIERAAMWRRLLQKELKILEEQKEIEVPIIKSREALYLIWRWYTDNEYSVLMIFKIEEAMSIPDLDWTKDAYKDIKRQIQEYIQENEDKLIQEVVDEDNKRNGSLSSFGIEEIWTGPLPVTYKAKFPLIPSVIITNDELAEENGYIRDGDKYVEE